MRQAILVAALAISVGCRPTATPQAEIADRANQGTHAGSREEAEIIAFCGDCHAMPDPGSFPQDAWRAEVQRGYDFYYGSGRSDLKVPIQAYVQRYFVARAPEHLQLAEPGMVDAAWVERFQRRDVAPEESGQMAVSFVDVVDAGEPLGRGVLFSDMRGGGIYFLPGSGPDAIGAPIEIGRVANPAVVRVCDWDGDGWTDFLVADLGSFLPSDHKRGRVVWFQQQADAPGHFEPRTLIDGVGRVASLEVADLDLDGQQDLLVAAFGWHDTGSIFWLRRSASGDPVESLEKHEIDSRPGTIHLPIVDLNADGAPDFVALVSQHYERVEAMINDGHGNFHSELIFAAPDPSYGSSGIDLADINGDGRIDVVYTNCDSFDSFILKPFHGVRWLENRGTFPFVNHDVGPMPGAHRAIAEDMDGDGREDIVGGAFLPRDLLLTSPDPAAEALVVYRQDAQGRFDKHVLSNRDSMHASLAVADLDGDGTKDIVVGNFREDAAEDGPALTIWYGVPAPRVAELADP